MRPERRDERSELGSFVRYALPVHAPRTMLGPSYQATLGYGLPAALGAKLACPERKVMGYWYDGAFAQRCVGTFVHRVPDQVPDAAAALTELLACCVHSVIDQASVRAGDVVAAVISPENYPDFLLIPLQTDTNRYKNATDFASQCC